MSYEFSEFTFPVPIELYKNRDFTNNKYKIYITSYKLFLFSITKNLNKLKK